MNNVLNHELPFERYFEELCRYPHGSFQEKVLSDHLAEFAVEHHLQYRQDEWGNIIIYKNGTHGLEGRPPLILQSHIDMVCEKQPGCEHNFETDPLDIYVEDGWIRARGTTLGADDGVGVAYMMAVLADDSIRHPPLECLFTVLEEPGCIGATHLKAEDFQGMRLLGLDEVSGDTTTVSAAGMKRIAFRYRGLRKETERPFYQLTVGGLSGGHSGDDIHKERGNANKIAARFLYMLLKKEEGMQLACMDGGTVDNAIPNACTVVFVSDRNENEIYADISALLEDISRELKYSDGAVTAKVVRCEPQPAFSARDSRNIIRFLFTCPNGFRHRDIHMELTTASSNLGLIKMSDDGLAVSLHIRGAALSFIDQIADEAAIIAEGLGWEAEATDSLPCWEYRENSPLRAHLEQAYERVTGTVMKEHAEHGCLEAGHFIAMKPGMDIATLGPLIKDYHTFLERVERASFAKIYDVLIALLENS